MPNLHLAAFGKPCGGEQTANLESGPQIFRSELQKHNQCFLNFGIAYVSFSRTPRTSNPVLSSGDIIGSGVLWSSNKCLAGACSESDVKCVASLMLFCNPKCAHKTRKNWIHVQIYLNISWKYTSWASTTRQALVKRRFRVSFDYAALITAV